MKTFVSNFPAFPYKHKTWKTLQNDWKLCVFDSIKLVIHCKNRPVTDSFREIKGKKSIGELLCKLLFLDGKKAVKKTK